VIDYVADLLDRHYDHHGVYLLFMEAGAPDIDTPTLVVAMRCRTWLDAANEDPGCEPLAVLGKVLRHFLESPLPSQHPLAMYDGPHDTHAEIDDARFRREREELVAHLRRHALQYHRGGAITTVSLGTPSRSLEQALRERNLPQVDLEFRRALEAADADPAEGAGAACTILEALFKHLIMADGLAMPSDQTIIPLWQEVRKRLALAPTATDQDPVKKMLQGLATVVHGVAELRTLKGNVHGRAPDHVGPESRQAKLAIHAAHTLVLFIIEEWEAAGR
jgi:hypothetical protein